MAKATRVASATAPIEGWRANVPLFRAIGTSASILLSVAWLTWQGSSWVSDVRGEMRELRQSIVAITKALDEKAAAKDVDHRFALMCARAPNIHRSWVCGEKG
jgi:hypothetical protein